MSWRRRKPRRGWGLLDHIHDREKVDWKSQPIYQNYTWSKYNVVSWVESWNRKSILVGKLVKSKKPVGQLIVVNLLDVRNVP